MELVEGGTLRDRTAALDGPARLALFREVCDAVAYAHGRGVIHRDLKPANILLDAAGRAKVVDFGVARALADDVTRTRSGHVLGTLAYMSPEQAAGDRARVDARSDVYALGVIAYELLAGRPPLALDGLSFPRAVQRLRDDDPPPLDAGGDLALIVGKALAKEPERRYPDAGALAADLARHARHEPVTARPPTARYRAARFVRRHRALVAGVAATILALALGLALALRAANRAAREEARARHTGALATLLAAGAAADGGDVVEFRRHLDAVPAGERGWMWRHLAARRDASRFSAPVPNARYHALDRTGARALLRDWQHGVHAFDTATGAALPLVLGDPPLRWGSVGFVDGAPHRFGVGEGRLQVRNLATGTGWTGPRAPRSGVAAARGARYALAGRGVLYCRGEGADWHLSVQPSALAFDATGARLAYAVGGGSLHLVDAGSGVEAWRQPSPRRVEALAFAPDGRLLAAGGTDHVTELRDAATGALRRRLRGHLATVRSVAFSPDGRWLATGASDRVIRIWDVASGVCEHVLYGHDAAAMALHFAAPGELVSVGVRTIRRWDVGRDVLRFPPSPPGLAGTGVAFSPDGTRLAVCADGVSVRVLDVATRRVLAVLPADGPVHDVAFRPDGRRLAAIGARLHVWDPDTGEELARRPSAHHRGVAYAPDGRSLLVTADHGVLVRDATTGAPLAEWRRARARDHPTLSGGLFHRAAWSPDGTLVAHAGDGAELLVRRRADGAVVRRCAGHERALVAIVFGPDGRTLVSTGRFGRTFVWDVATGARRFVLEGHVGLVYGAAVTPDGARIATGGNDGRILVWDAATGERRGTLRGHRRPVRGLAFSPDGATLASVDAGGTVRFWATRESAGD